MAGQGYESFFILSGNGGCDKSWEKFSGNPHSRSEIFRHMEESMEKIYEHKMK